ncbi:MAG: GAF domain-containing protein [Actinobacteria bacterium]|nr:GAF domain-containing protein [Actinomycetota bacterium]
MQTRETSVLTELIATVTSSLDRAEVLRSVVRLMTEGSGVHACFVYLIDTTSDRLVLEAANRPYEALLGEAALARGEGIGWWVAEHRQPVFIRENAPADPRFRHVPGIDEERFQSFLCIPLLSRAGAAIGVVTAHTEAPREFTREEAEFLISSASLVAGAVENARLYDETRGRVEDLERLVDLGEAVAGADTLDELVAIVVERATTLLRGTRCRVYLLDGASEELALRAAWPDAGAGPERVRLASLGPELARGRRSRVSVPLVAGQELVGLLVAEGTGRLDLARAVASQTAVAIKKVQLIERLTERNLITDFFEGIAAGRAPELLEGPAARLGFDLAGTHVALAARPAGTALEQAIASIGTRVLCERKGDELRAFVPLAGTSADRLLEIVASVRTATGSTASIGLSSACKGPAGLASGLEEARQALVATAIPGAGPIQTFDDLGAYKYLLPVALEGGVRDPMIDAISRLDEYDRQRGTALVGTLEEFLRRHGSISATAEALYVHQNTLRQRLRRIAEISGVDLRRDDWLAVELAVRMARLRRALQPGPADA